MWFQMLFISLHFISLKRHTIIMFIVVLLFKSHPVCFLQITKHEKSAFMKLDYQSHMKCELCAHYKCSYVYISILQCIYMYVLDYIYMNVSVWFSNGNCIIYISKLSLCWKSTNYLSLSLCVTLAAICRCNAQRCCSCYCCRCCFSCNCR